MLELNYPDKILAGVNQSYTFLSDEGAPEGTISVAGRPLPHRIVPLGPPKDEPTGTPKMKFKVTFFIPGDTAGKKLELRFKAAASAIDDAKDITAA